MPAERGGCSPFVAGEVPISDCLKIFRGERGWFRACEKTSRDFETGPRGLRRDGQRGFTPIHPTIMKTRLLNQDTALLLGIASAILLAATSPALEIVASSFGGCGTSGSASFATAGTSHPGAARPAGCPSMTYCPGPLATAFQTVIAGEPKAHLVPTGPGLLTLMKVPDSPGWSWEQSHDLSNWSPMPEPAANPVLIPTDQPRRFFRLQKP